MTINLTNKNAPSHNISNGKYYFMLLNKSKETNKKNTNHKKKRTNINFARHAHSLKQRVECCLMYRRIKE